ncbi:hypothetical protein Aduo_011389 [Ancylostoma duodenale]
MTRYSFKSKVRRKPQESGKEVQDEPCSSKSKAVAVNNMKRGHRRAWSMPNAKGEKMTELCPRNIDNSYSG